MKAKLTVDDIIDLILKWEGYSREQVLVKCRKRELVMTRQIAMYFCREFTPASLSSIGQPFAKDHATALHARKTINNLCDTEKDLNEKITEYRKRLKLIARRKENSITGMVDIWKLTKFAYRNVLSADEIGRYAGYMAPDTIYREIAKLVRYEKRLSRII